MKAIKTLQEVADYYNESEHINTFELEQIIESNGWISDCGTERGVCHDALQKVVINDDGEAEVIRNEDNAMYLVCYSDGTVQNSYGMNCVYDISGETTDDIHPMTFEEASELLNALRKKILAGGFGEEEKQSYLNGDWCYYIEEWELEDLDEDDEDE